MPMCIGAWSRTMVYGLVSALTVFAICALADGEFRSQKNMGAGSDIFSDPPLTKLAAAIDRDDVQEIERLVQAKVPLNMGGQKGITPLIYAVGNRKKKSMAALMRLGADPNQFAEGNMSAVMLCAGADDIELLRIVLDGKGNPNLLNDRNQPVSFTAASQQRWDNLKLLLERGADINARDSAGRTLTLFRAQLDYFDWVYRLLEVGADPDVKNKQGWSLAHYVQDSKLRDSSDQGKWKLKVKAFLEKHGTHFPVPSPVPNS